MMNLETPSTGFGRWASSLLVFASSTLNLFHQASSSATPDVDPEHQSPESTLQGGSDTGMPPQCPESESIEAKSDELPNVVPDSISSYPPHPLLFSSASASSSSSSTIPYEEENTLSSLPLLRRSQINSRVSFSSKEPSPLFSTKNSHDPDFPTTNSQNLYSAKAERWEHRDATQSDVQPAETTSRTNRDRFDHDIDVTNASIPSYPSPSSSTIPSRQEATVSSFSSSSPPSTTGHSQPAAERTGRVRNPNFLHVMEIIDEQQLGKHILGLAIPMGVGLVFSTSALAKTTEMRVVVIALSFAIAAIWNGLLLRKTNPNTSTSILILGIAMMMLAFYAFVGCFLPLYLKWIPGLCWLASLVPFCRGWFGTYFPGKKVTDPERGDL